MAHAEILSTHTPDLFEAAATRAAQLLSAGEVVALPTETVYGLAANALNADAIARLYEIKGRPAHNPIIVHVKGLPMAYDCAASWPELAELLARAFWPGPLTLVVPHSARIPEIVTAGGTTVGVRWPSHPFMQAVIRQCGFPLAAPSANLSNQLSPTNAAHVQHQLGDRIRLIVDGGQSQVGIESTVVDVTAEPPRLLRPGMIHEEALLAVTGQLQHGPGGGGNILRSPGLLLKHYAPKARLLVLRWSDEEDLLRQLHERSLAPQGTHIVAHTQLPSEEALASVSVIPHDAEAFARALYAELHRCDAAGAQTIVVEAVPDLPAWHAIADRLNRGAAIPQ
jgi:L-threonylcarbamoyladenylate synthase